MELAALLSVIFLAAFTHSLVGFGSALIAMSFLPGLIGIHGTTPLVALVAATIEIALLLRYRSTLNLRAVWRLIAASILGIPLGLLFLKQVDERLALLALGLLITGYAVYGLANIRPPRLHHPAWEYGLGLLAGMLGAAYNTSGPPVVIFGDSQRWEPVEFKSNLQGFFLMNDLLVIAGHAVSGNLTPVVVQNYLWSLPVIIAAVLAGLSLDRYIKPEAFRKVVLALVVLMGIRLLV